LTAGLHVLQLSFDKVRQCPWLDGHVTTHMLVFCMMWISGSKK